MSASGGWTQLAVRLPIAIMHRGLRTLGWRSFEGVTLCIQRLRARIRHRDFYLLPFHRAPTVRLRTPRTSVVAPIVHASSATMDPQGQPLFVESRAKHFRTLCRAEALINSLCGGDGRVIDPPVEKQHDQHRYIERTKSAINDVAGIVGQLADPRTWFHGDEDSGGVERSVLSKRHVVRGMRPFVFPADQGWEADDEAQDPHGCNQQPCSPRRHDLRITDWPGHS